MTRWIGFTLPDILVLAHDAFPFALSFSRWLEPDKTPTAITTTTKMAAERINIDNLASRESNVPLFYWHVDVEIPEFRRRFRPLPDTNIPGVSACQHVNMPTYQRFDWTLHAARSLSRGAFMPLLFSPSPTPLPRRTVCRHYMSLDLPITMTSVPRASPSLLTCSGGGYLYVEDEWDPSHLPDRISGILPEPEHRALNVRYQFQ